MNSIKLGINIAILAIFTFLLISNSCNRKAKKELLEYKALYEALNDTVVTYRNKLNQEVAVVKTLKANNVKIVLELKSKDYQVNQLQSLIKRYEDDNARVLSALVFSNRTIFTLKDSISKIIGYTKAPGDSIVYPIYSKSFTDDEKKWIKGDVILGKDSFNIGIEIRNEYTVANVDEKVGLFKRNTVTVVENLNPYSDSTKLQSFYLDKTRVKPLPRNLGIAIGTFILTLLIFK